MRIPLKKVVSHAQQNNRRILLNVCHFCGILIICLGIPAIYSHITPLWLRLIFAALMIGAVFWIWSMLVKRSAASIHQKLSRCLLSSIICILLSIALVAFVFFLATLILSAFSPSVEVFRAITVYGSYILIILLYPVLCLLLFLPVAVQNSFKAYTSCLWKGLRRLYLRLLLVGVLLVAVNALLALLIQQAAIQTILSSLFSILLWTVSWELCLINFADQSSV